MSGAVSENGSAVVRRWVWQESSILYNNSPYVPPRDIFQAVCDELGRYFSEKGAKYTKSNRKIKIKFEHLLCECGLWSSHGNIQGEWVNLEIVTNIYALDTGGMEKKGLLYVDIRPKNFNVYGIDSERFFEIVDYMDKTMEFVKSFDSADGINKLGGADEFVNRNANNRIYFERL